MEPHCRRAESPSTSASASSSRPWTSRFRRAGGRTARPERRREDHADADPVRRPRARGGHADVAGPSGDRRRPPRLGVHATGAGPVPRHARARPAGVDRRLHGLDRAEGRRRAGVLLGQLDLAARERDKISTLSGGMAQRVQLAAAMVHGPDLLVLDEPFAGLDPVAVRFLSDVITEHTRAGRNLLFSSHQLDLVEDLCETITLLNHGRVVLQGDLRELKAESPIAGCASTSGRPSWVDPRRPDGVVDARGTRLRLEPHADPGGPRRHPPARACRRLRRRSPEPVGALPRGRRRRAEAA